ncbi:MAG: hypothetical protein R2822_07540 [Spirosomataceae bacterium]
MKNTLKLIVFLGITTALFSSCEPKSPFPEIKNGANFVARPDPLPAAVTAANITTMNVALVNVASANMTFTTQSLNANEIEKVEVYASHLRGTTVTPAATTAAPHGVLLKALASINGKEQVAVSELLTKTGMKVADLRANDRLRIRFVVIMKDGRVFSWQNAGPGINANPLGTTFTPLLDVLLQ